jgi:RimJ/RimL family protein N-acetyltransferase
LKACDIPANERDALQHTEVSCFLAELRPTDGLYVVWHGMEIASYGAVMSRSPQHSVLGLNEHAPLIGLCETVLSHRRRGLYSRALAQTARELGLQGKTTVFVEVLEDNDASIAGIMKAGFAKWRLVDAQIWFGTFVRRDGYWHRVRRHD